MKKSILALVIVGFLVGCGGGGGGSSPSEGARGSSDHSENSGGDGGTTQQSRFQYPNLFEDYKIFKYTIDTKSTAGVTVYALGDMGYLTSAIAVEAIVGLAVQGPLILIDDNPDTERGNCEKGSLTSIQYSESSNPVMSGTFEMDNFSGVSVNIGGSGDECSSGYFDGYIDYSNSEKIVTVTYGRAIIDEPFFEGGSDGLFAGSMGLLGSLKVEFPDHDSSIYTIEDGKYLEIFEVESDLLTPYIKGSYKKRNLIVYRNAKISHIKKGDQFTFNADYIREWNEFGETFVLYTKITDLIYTIDSGISAGTIRYELSVKGKPNRHIEADVSYNLGTTIHYIKEDDLYTN